MAAMKIIENYKIIFQDEEFNYSPLKHYFVLVENGVKIGRLSNEFKTNHIRELFRYKDWYYEVQLEELSLYERMIYDVIKIQK